MKAFERTGVEARGCRSFAEARLAFSESRFDIVLSDFELDGGETSSDLLVWVRQLYPGTRCILVSGRSQIERLADPETQFISKPVTAEKLETAIVGSCCPAIVGLAVKKPMPSTSSDERETD